MGRMMIRNKIIGAFVAVWFVVCLCYMGVRTMAVAFADDAAVAQSEPVTQTTSDDSSATSDLSAQDEAGQDLAVQNLSVQDTSQEDTEPQDANAEPDQEEQAAIVPSLSEYLSHFTCGSCHRNCPLNNPRCHNGSRLARAKAEEYYSLYG